MSRLTDAHQSLLEVPSPEGGVVSVEEFNSWPAKKQKAYRDAENARLDAWAVEQDARDAAIAAIPWEEPPAPAKEAPHPPFNPHVDGLVGEIADWVTATSYTPQPILSLSAAIAFMGLVKSHRVKGFTDFRTNIYCFSLAPTGGGKEHPQKCINRLAHACGIGKHMLGKPVSGAGMLTGLSKADGRGLLSLSEVGHYVANITSKNSGSYQKEIGTLIIELSTQADITYYGNQYGNEKANPQSIIQQPSLSILGSSVPERMQAAVTGGEVIDGFLNRWLAFQVTSRPQIPKTVKEATPPEELVEKIKQWLDDNPTNTDNYGAPHPKLMQFTREAFDDLMKYKEAMRAMLDSVPYPINQLYVRSAEHAEKIAMILSDSNDIGIPELNKAIEIVTQSNRVLAEFCRGISDSPHDAMVHKVLELIKKAQSITGNGSLSKRDLHRAARWIEPKKLADIIYQLIEAEEIEADKSGKSIKYRYLG